ncbi:hypothetical protein [Spirosoma agri]|uniref:Uncharacterized protein n=1 Tax=Spirosoma agri TaxID=1987381 RepID=A0A6M0IHT5_9BACT|nr:hypothetical protein [Spirosoma agri]NEU67829.1 hypothetical protein [Spirosoma agri]
MPTKRYRAVRLDFSTSQYLTARVGRSPMLVTINPWPFCSVEVPLLLPLLTVPARLLKRRLPYKGS